MTTLDVVGVDMNLGDAFNIHARERFNTGLGGGLTTTLTHARVTLRHAEGRSVRAAIHATFDNGDDFQAVGDAPRAHDAFDAAFDRLEKQVRRRARARRGARRDSTR